MFDIDVVLPFFIRNFFSTITVAQSVPAHELFFGALFVIRSPAHRFDQASNVMMPEEA